jgi:hypothetical protein
MHSLNPNHLMDNGEEDMGEHDYSDDDEDDEGSDDDDVKNPLKRPREEGGEEGDDKPKKKKLKGKGGSSCHQCKSRRNFTALTYCTSTLDKKNKKCRKKFCGHCLKKFYKVCILLYTHLLTTHTLLRDATRGCLFYATTLFPGIALPNS